MKTPAVIVCLAVAASPAWGLAAKIAAPADAPVHKVARKAPRKAEAKPGAKAAPAIAKAYAAMPSTEILAIQSDLAWIGDYEGPPSGDVDERMIEAVKLVQKAGGGKETGILDDQQRTRLAAAAKPAQQHAGWTLIDDPVSGTRFGLPAKFVSPAGEARLGNRWNSGRGQIQIESFRLREANLAALFEEEKKSPRDRHADWSALKDNAFIIAGTQGLKNVVVRAQARGTEVRGITILYDQATAGIMQPVSIAMANSFVGFPDLAAALPAGERRGVDYGTAIVVDGGGDLVATDQLTAGCDALMVPGYGHAARIADDPASDLALLRLYGARNLVPPPFATDAAAGGDLALVGIAAPAVQEGGGAVTRAAAHLDGRTLTPPPALGFSGAAATDAHGRLAGVVDLKSAAVAGPGPTASQAELVPAATVRAFLSAHRVAPAGGNAPIEQSVLRIICVRK